MADTFKQWCLPQVNVTVAAGRTRQVHGYRSLACLVAQWCLALRDPIEPTSLASPALQADSLPLSYLGSPRYLNDLSNIMLYL